MAYLLDTNHCSYIINGLNKQPAKRKAEEIKTLRVFENLTQPAYTCEVVVGELYYGAELTAKPEAIYQRIDRFLATVTPLLANKSCWSLFAKTKAELTRKGKLIPDFDLLIACIAKNYDFILVSNDGAFKHLPASFEVENWAAGKL